jgi:phosphoribosylformylglycinamidine synthase
MILSAHDISEGGLFVTLTESGFFKELGFSVSQQSKAIRKDAYWFGEAQGRVVVTVDAEKVNEFEGLLKVPFEKLGIITSGNINVDNEDWGNIAGWKNKYDNAIGNYLNSKG